MHFGSRESAHMQFEGGEEASRIHSVSNTLDASANLGQYVREGMAVGATLAEVFEGAMLRLDSRLGGRRAALRGRGPGPRRRPSRSDLWRRARGLPAEVRPRRRGACRRDGPPHRGADHPPRAHGARRAERPVGVASRASQRGVGAGLRRGPMRGGAVHLLRLRQGGDLRDPARGDPLAGLCHGGGPARAGQGTVRVGPGASRASAASSSTPT